MNKIPTLTEEARRTGKERPIAETARLYAALRASRRRWSSAREEANFYAEAGQSLLRILHAPPPREREKNLPVPPRQWHQARRYLERALRLRALPARETASLHNLLGLTWRQLGQLDRAIQSYSSAREIYRQRGEPLLVGEMAVNLSNLHFRRGDAVAAMEQARKAVALFGNAGNEKKLAPACGVLGHAYLAAGELEKAAASYRRSRDLAAKHGDLLLASRALHGLGNVAFYRGDLEQAREDYRSSWDQKREALLREGHRNPSREFVYHVGNLAGVDLEEGKFPRAASGYFRAYRACRRTTLDLAWEFLCGYLRALSELPLTPSRRRSWARNLARFRGLSGSRSLSYRQAALHLWEGVGKEFAGKTREAEESYTRSWELFRGETATGHFLLKVVAADRLLRLTLQQDRERTKTLQEEIAHYLQELRLRGLGKLPTLRRLEEDLEQAGRSLASSNGPLWVADSPLMRELERQVAAAARTLQPVLIVGETGSGKTALARRLVAAGPRPQGPLVVLDAGTVANDLLTAEWFGVRKNAFTGAEEDRTGLLVQSEGGTLLLEQVEEFSPEAQNLLLRFLEERKVRPVGGLEWRDVDCRIMATATPRLFTLMGTGQFRSDFYYRLNIIRLRVPPLRERREDLPRLLEQFGIRCAREAGQPPKRFSPEIRERLARHLFPGNLRELEHLIQRWYVTVESPEIGPADWEEPGHDPGPRRGFPSLAEIEQDHIRLALRVAENNRRKAARILGITHPTLYRKLKEMNDLPSPAGKGTGQGQSRFYS